MKPHLRIFELVCLLALVAACTGTREAYQAADTLDEYAYVVTEHYAAAVTEAADLKERPSTPTGVVVALQRADDIARPLVLELRPLSEAYEATRTAETEAKLQAALDRAVLALSDFITLLRESR